MALTRKFLAALGIEDEKIDEIIQAHTDTVNGLKDEIEKYKTDAEKLPAVVKERDDLKKAADESNGKNPYKVKYEGKTEPWSLHTNFCTLWSTLCIIPVLYALNNYKRQNPTNAAVRPL